MKQGRTLVTLGEELDRQMRSKEDYIVDTRNLQMFDTEDDMRLIVQGDFSRTYRYPIKRNAHRQIGERIKIPAKYYNRMLTDAPGLLARNVNHWFQAAPEQRMLRVMDTAGNGIPQVRAFLSNKYRRLDNYDLMQVVIPILRGKESEGLRIESCEVTENKLYIKAVTPRLEADIAVGDTVQAGICISNSEVGKGAVKIEPLVFRLSCSNGMICRDMGMSKHHLGRVLEGGDDHGNIRRLFKDDTLKATDDAFWRQVRDVVEGSLSEEVFNQIVDKMKDAKGIPVESPIKAVEKLAKLHSFSDREQEQTLVHLIESGQSNMYGLSNAVTQTSQDVSSYDRATELEGIGYSVLNMDPSTLN